MQVPVSRRIAVTLGVVLAAVSVIGPAPSVTADPRPTQDCALPAGDSPRGAPFSGEPNDPLFDRQWGLDQVNAPEAWALGATGRGAVIAVIDTGVDLRHPDLRANLLPGVNLLESIDGCARPYDDNGHGTTVAGVAAAVTNNGIGVAGVAPDAKIMPIRAIKIPLLTRGPIDRAIRYAADHGARVIQLTAFTNVAPTDDPLDAHDDEIAEAIDYAWDSGSVIVAPAVNADQPMCSYPAAEKHVICAAATDRNSAPASYSNLPFKPEVGPLALRAPGGLRSIACDDNDIWTTAIVGDGCDGTGYSTVSGSSYAAPHVAGVAALLAGLGRNRDQIIDCLKKTSFNPVTGQRGKYDPIYGWGIVDAGAAASSC